MVTCMPLGKVKSVVAGRWKGFGGGPCGGVSLAPANTSLDMAESHLDYSLCASYASGGEAAPGSISNTVRLVLRRYSRAVRSTSCGVSWGNSDSSESILEGSISNTVRLVLRRYSRAVRSTSCGGSKG